MSKEINRQGNKQYYVVFNGKFARRAKDGEEAIERINKNNKQVREIHKDSLIGMITNIYFEPSEYGNQLKIELDPLENGAVPVIGFGVESKDGRDIMKKLPALNFVEEVEFVPYRFEENNVSRSGITLYQKGEKVLNFFFDGEKKEFLHGFPTIDWDNASESEHKIYKIKRDDFLIAYMTEHILPKFQGAKLRPQSEDEAADEAFAAFSEGNTDVPF